METVEQGQIAAKIGKIQSVKLREVWKHEALDFTTWLQENIDVVNDALDIELQNPEREKAAGDFSVDLVAEDESGGLVVIENQLEKSDHDHLGKLLTYLVAIGARTAVWIVSDPRPEHVSTVSWLNESSPASFYLLKVEAIKIGDSPPAALLTLVVGPSEEGKEVGETKKEIAERYGLRRRFWTELLERAAKKTKLHANVSPGAYYYLQAGSGKQGITFNYIVRQHDAHVELYIDRGKDSEEQNKQILETLMASREEIEDKFGGPLEWDSVEGRRSCRIAGPDVSGGYRDEEKWPETQEATIDAMVRLHEALGPHISKLKV